jgi:hypothetical protein
MTPESSHGGSGRALLRLDLRRLAARVRRPRAGDTIAAALPLLLLAASLWGAPASAVPRLDSRGDGAALGMLLAAPIAFLSYGVLFRASDDPFLRRLGVDPRSLYAERAARLLCAALGLVLALTALAASAGRPVAPLLIVSLAAAIAAWGAGAAASSLAALAMARRSPGQGWGCLAAGMWDRELAAVAPLVHAPLVPLLAGGAAGAAAWGRGAGAAAGVAVLGLALAWVASGWWAAALPRFAPQLQEMAFDPPPPAGVGELGVGRGLARILPHHAAAAMARDALVAARRFPWSTRIVWPVAIVSLALLARWGGQAETRSWVATAAVTVWVVQVAAMVGLGRYERAGRRWLDRSLGIGGAQRLLGRWAWGWGASLYLAIPLALGWQWWAGAGPGWPWLLVGAGTAAVGAVASVLVAGSR